jgi:hypothetical protein
MKDDKKQSFFDQIKRFVDPTAGLPEGQPRAPRRPAPGEGVMRTDQLKSSVSTARLGNSPRTAELGPVDPLAGIPQDKLSVRRLSMIDDFMNGRIKVERMSDPTYMYKIASDERAYQAWVLTDLKQQLAQQRDRRGPEAMQLEKQIRDTSAIMQNLFKVLKYITGKKGHTGGTDFLT